MRQPNDNHFVSARGRIPFGSRANLALIGVALIGALLGVTLGPASATTEVHGQQDNLELRVQNASIREILDALSARFKLTYKLPPSINRNLSGLYSGTLHQALARILDGNNFAVIVSDGDVEVVIFGASGTIANAPMSEAAAVSEPTVVPLAPSKSDAAPVKPITLSSKSSPPPLSTYLSANGPTVAGEGTNTP